MNGSIVIRWIVQKLLSRPCEPRIPRSGSEGERVDCFVVLFDKNGRPYFVAERLDGDSLIGLRWDGQSYCIKHSILVSEVNDYDLCIIHYYGLNKIVFDSFYEFIFHYVTRLVYVRVRIRNFLNRLDQFFFNKRNVFAKDRMDILKYMVFQRLTGVNDGIGLLELMNKIYSVRWVLHPSAEQQQTKLELYLESLIDSGDVRKVNGNYMITGKAMSTIEQFEKDERRHREAVVLQRSMVFLTIILVLSALVQAGLVKFPTLIDWSL